MPFAQFSYIATYASIGYKQDHTRKEGIQSEDYLIGTRREKVIN